MNWIGHTVAVADAVGEAGVTVVASGITVAVKGKMVAVLVAVGGIIPVDVRVAVGRVPVLVGATVFVRVAETTDVDGVPKYPNEVIIEIR